MIKIDLEKISEALNIEPWRIRGALNRGSIQILKKPFTYLVFRKDLGKIERGTAVFLNNGNIEVVRGFPKIKRAFYLKPALKKFKKVAVEEKMDGYNTRVFILNNEIYAVTRGGYICPYTTKKLREDKSIEKFLKENPEYVLCGESVGRQNPYVVHEYKEAKDFGFFAFDLRKKGENIPLPVLERKKILEDYGIRNVRLFGIFDKDSAYKKIFEILKELEKENREGVVIKDPEMKKDPIKYTTSKTNTNDLKYGFKYPFELGKDFFFSRVVREAFQAFEVGESEEKLKERARRLGESILIPFVESIRKVSRGEVLTEDFEVLLKNSKDADELIEYLRRQGIILMFEKEKLNSKIKLKVQRLMQASNDKIKSFIEKGIE